MMQITQGAQTAPHGGAVVPHHIAPRRSARGKAAYHRGISAENLVSDRYSRRGGQICQKRFRTRRGEIDLVVQDGDTLVFVEVKQRKTHDAALHALQRKQIMRLWNCAQEYLATCPAGLDTIARFDVATVDGMGDVQVLENVDFS